MATNEELLKQISQLKQQLSDEKEKNEKKIVLKVSEKGAIQINGIRRMPITLYKAEMETILNMSDTINNFITDNISKLSVKKEKST